MNDHDSNRQQYISELLCHFVGRGQDEAGQFTALQSILNEKILKFDPLKRMPDATAMYSTESFEKFGEITQVPAVCFCDIPENQLNLHCRKYSKFGLAFKKDKMLIKGIRPVWYIPKNSYSSIANNEQIKDRFPKEMNRVLSCLDIINKKLTENTDIAGPANKLSDDLELQEHLKKAPSSFHFLIGELFWFFKFFDANLSDDDAENYYFEREWRRVNRDVDFEYSDLERIFVPNDFFKDKLSEKYTSLASLISVI